MLSFGQSVQGVMVRGIDPVKKPPSRTRQQDQGRCAEDLRSGEFGIVLGTDLARALGVRLGEKIMLIAPQGQITPAGWCRA